MFYLPWNPKMTTNSQKATIMPCAEVSSNNLVFIKSSILCVSIMNIIINILEILEITEK